MYSVLRENISMDIALNLKKMYIVREAKVSGGIKLKKSVVDYRSFRLRKIKEPQFRHLLFLSGWIGYLLLYILTERFIPYERCISIHCVLDERIPFCEYFVIPYVGWYFLILGSLIYFAFYNPDNFKNMMKFIIIVQIIGMVIYILFPNRQDLRPEVFERDNIFTKVIGFLYKIDTCTNVCPSMHVAYSIGIASVWLKEESASKWCKFSIIAFCLLVCISVVFVKQHSVIDILVAIPLCIFAEWVVLKKWRG